MSVFNSTDVIDNSIFLKAKLSPNMVGDNYYIENLQDKRDSDWEYRYNRVEIEEELNKQTEYTIDSPLYTPIDVVITNVKSEKGEDLGTDWATIAFRDLKHPNKIGSRYRFALNFPDMTKMSEEEKYYDTSVWLCVNKTPVRAGNSCLIRRCNTNLIILGYKNRDRRKKSTMEIHYEPVVLVNDQMKYMQIYYNQTAPVPQSEWYAILQLNYFTDAIKINDRFILGTIDDEVQENNSVYKVKAVIKSNTSTTFSKGAKQEMENTPLLILAMDKDAVAPQDNFKTRVANNAPVYLIPDETDNNINSTIIDGTQKQTNDQEKKEKSVYTLVSVDSVDENIPMYEARSYKLKLLLGDEEITDYTVQYSVQLTKKKETDWGKYFNIIYDTDGIGFTVQNLKTCLGSVLEVTVTCTASGETSPITKSFEIALDRL
jgi:hypothetical protein